jgi:1-acyl-sn-glycerol-3-phosphate acyltransferase
MGGSVLLEGEETDQPRAAGGASFPALHPILNVVQWLFLAFWSVLWISLALLVAVVTRKQELALAMARRIWAPPLRWIVQARIELEPMPDIDWTKPHVFVMNHESMLDIVVAFIVLPVNLRFVAKHVLRYVPFLGWYMWATGMIFVHRGKGGVSMGSLQASGARVRAGANVLVFPEGTRARESGFLPFKKGAFVLATAAQVPVVPVAIAGSRRCLPADGFRTRPGTVRVKVGAPIPTTGLTREDLPDLIGRTRRALSEMHVSIGGQGAVDAAPSEPTRQSTPG